MKTVDQVISRFRRYFSDCDTTTALDLFQTALKRIYDKAQLRQKDVAFTSIVAGTREYDWAEGDLKCYGVTWYNSATDFFALFPASTDELDDINPAWRESTESGTPSRFYVRAVTDASSNKTGKLVFGFDIIPS